MERYAYFFQAIVSEEELKVAYDFTANIILYR